MPGTDPALIATVFLKLAARTLSSREGLAAPAAESGPAAGCFLFSSTKSGFSVIVPAEIAVIPVLP